VRDVLLCILLSAGFVVSHLSFPEIVHTAVITVVNLDGLGEGFNDPSAPDLASTTGGNNGATLGAQRFIAFQYAANIWAIRLLSPVEIRVDATFDPLTCGSTSATLGSAGARTAIRDFTGAPVANTWYPVALANSLAGMDLDPASSDITARFNSSIGTTCAFPLVWYYGLNADPPPGTLDFVSVVLHELGHGLGFATLVNLQSGAKALGFDDAFSLKLEDHSTGKLYPQMTNAERVIASQNSGNLHWVGANVVAASGTLTAGVHPTGHVQMYAPNPQQPGSSVSHFDTAVSPNELMEPFFAGANHNVALTLELFEDLGWATAPAPPAGSTDVDFDGDGKSDIAIYRNGTWFIRRSSGGVTSVSWGGLPQDIPVPADYDGDERSDIAVYRDGTWFIIRSSNGGVTVVGWGGLAQDIPVPGDYDGDGRADIAVYRDGTWYILRSSDGGATVTGWGGLAQDIPVPGDYDGDGRVDIAVYRDGTWFIIRSSDGGVTTVGWGGLAQDIPVPADYDGDGKADIVVYRSGTWFILRSFDGGVTTAGWGGLAQDVPVPADYDGDGRTDLAVYRDGIWFIRRSSDGVQTTVGWGGLAQDMPLH
jgi:FG-GAP-like repeat